MDDGLTMWEMFCDYWRKNGVFDEDTLRQMYKAHLDRERRFAARHVELMGESDE